jgi:hypothetical protein
VCGRPWIDTLVDEDLPPLTPEIVTAAIEDRKTATPTELAPPPDAPAARPWGLLVGIGLGLVFLYVLFFIVLGGGDDDSAASPTTASTSVTTADQTSTSTSAATTTSEPGTSTTTSTTTTTTTTTTTLAPIEPSGDPIAVSDLTLGAFALGPFTFTDNVPALGRLVASLGQPDAMETAGTDLGLCDGQNGVAYTWDGLTAIFRLEGDTPVLAGYRLDSTGDDGPAQSITTRSGLALGYTVETLEGIYLQSGIAYEEIDGSSYFVLLRSTDNRTLLWGPVSSTDPSGIVEGIYSPRPCDGGPTATP